MTTVGSLAEKKKKQKIMNEWPTDLPSNFGIRKKKRRKTTDIVSFS